MRQLNISNLINLKLEGIDTPLYRTEQSAPKTGIVHLGPGAFFRAHQAWYTDQAMQKHGGDWGITAVSMRSQGVKDALGEQDGLYCLAELDEETSFQIIGSICEVLVAKTEFEEVVERLIQPTTKFVTLTITEKGYCLNGAGQLDTNNEDVKADLLETDKQVSAIGLLTKALGLRKRLGLKPFCILSCDNITDNGIKLKNAIVNFAQLADPGIKQWLEKELICPCTMVDSITPATNDELRTTIKESIGIKDNWPIKRESFVQWVIEDILPEERPAWDRVGAILTNDVRGFENAKLRLLNCPHSSIAYLGVLLGIETVFDAMQNKTLVAHIEHLIDSEVIPSFIAPKELDAYGYSREILERFKNPAIRHLLSQIAWDGSQKLPMRIVPIVEQNLKDGRSISRLCISLVSWFLFLRKRYIDNQEIIDPLAAELASIASKCCDNPKHDIAKFVGISAVFSSELAANKTFIANLELAYEQLLPLLTNTNYSWSKSI